MPENSEEIIRILIKYIDNSQADSFLVKFCKNRDLDSNSFTANHYPRLIIELVKAREDFDNLDDKTFYQLFKDLISFTNDKLKDTMDRIIARKNQNITQF